MALVKAVMDSREEKCDPVVVKHLVEEEISKQKP